MSAESYQLKPGFFMTPGCPARTREAEPPAVAKMLPLVRAATGSRGAVHSGILAGARHADGIRLRGPAGW